VNPDSQLDSFSVQKFSFLRIFLHFSFGMKLKLENPNSELFIAIILLKILDVATTYYAVKYFVAEEMNPLAPYVTSNPELMIFGFLGFAAMVSLLYFSQPFILSMASSRERDLVRTLYFAAFVFFFLMMLIVVLNNIFQLAVAFGLI